MRRHLPATAALIVLASCATPPEPAPMPAPRAVPTYVPAPPPPVKPVSSDWRDWALTPGDWRYVQRPGSPYANFEGGGRPRLTITCDLGARQIRLAGLMDGPVTIRTTSLTRALATTPVAGEAALTLSARDPLLDAIAFSRGRFIVEQAGQAPLVIPAYAEIGRVIEDCRG